VTTIQNLRMNCKNNVKINFDGGDLSSDSGLLLYKDFIEVLGVKETLVEHIPSLNDGKNHRDHENIDALLQKIYQKIAGYHTDSAANNLREDPVFQEITEKEYLASQATLSRYNNCLTKDSMKEFQQANLAVLDNAYQIQTPNLFIYDLDSTHADTCGEQYGSAYNSHYGKTGFHPLVMFNGSNRDFLKALLRSGNVYTSRDVVRFAEDVFIQHQNKYSEIKKYVRADSGFAKPELYQCCERRNLQYAIRLKANSILYKKAEPLLEQLRKNSINSNNGYGVVYGSFPYQAASWVKERRVVVKIEQKPEKLIPDYTFVVTNINAKVKAVIKFYSKRGTMENFIKESKYGFALDKLSSTDYWTNANKLQHTVLAYNIHNLMRRLCFPEEYQKDTVQTTRVKVIKIAGRKVSSGRYTYFKLSSHAVYKKLFLKIHQSIRLIAYSKAA